MKKEKLSFILGIHCHQPVGNFGWVIEKAFLQSYQPFIELLSKFPQMKIAAHFSGPLLEWIEANHPEYLYTIRGLVEAGKMEIIGGGFYEPVLQMIPEIDRLEQLEMMSQYAELNLGQRPEGIWLTERIWEPALPSTLRAAGMGFTFTDDSHFFQSGLNPDSVNGYFITEDEGRAAAIFPIDQTLRYLVPFKEPKKTVEYLKKQYDRGCRSCYTLFDDGEKFGLWPGTNTLLYEEGRLEEFFEALLAESDWLDITLPGVYLEENPPEGLAYLPTTSYFEMGQWTLPPENNRTIDEIKKLVRDKIDGQVETYVKGGFFRNFFVRYPESNHMHKRMLEISNKIHLSDLEGQPRDRAKNALFQAQCNCAYWHGIFGGLYLPHLREAIYENLIKAEKFVETDALKLELYDLDFDGQEVFSLRNQALACIIKPSDGGALVELDHLATNTNVINTLARRPEAYHILEEEKKTDEIVAEEKAVEDGEDVSEEASIHDQIKKVPQEYQELLVYDEHRKACFRDFLLDANTLPNAKDLQSGAYAELGALSCAHYEYDSEETQEEARVLLFKDVKPTDDTVVGLAKRYALKPKQSTLCVKYITNVHHASKEETNLLLGIQFNLSVAAALDSQTPFSVDDKPLEATKLLDKGETNEAHAFSITDPHKKLRYTINTNRKGIFAYHPIETVSQSEEGFDKNYQASSVWLLLPMTLHNNEEKAFEITLSLAQVEA